MIIKHKLGNLEKEFENENPQFILRNKNGDFLFYSTLYNISKYNGFFNVIEKNNDSWEMIKSIENFELKKDIGEIPVNVEINQNEKKIIKKFNDGTIEKISLKEINFNDDNKSIINYEIKNYNGELKLILDTRKIHDYSNQGRIYKIYKKTEFVIIEYEKYLDNDLNKLDYKAYTIIKGINQFEKINKWFEKNFDFDSKRESYPYQFYVFHALDIKIENEINLQILTTNNLEEGIKILKEQNNYNIINNQNFNINIKNNNYIITLKEKEIFKIENIANLNENNIIAFNYACHSIYNSIVKIQREGIYAGLPWFYQFWTRDEAISLYGASLINLKDEVKLILLNMIKNISEDGRIPNRIPSSLLGSADGVGWVFKRIDDLINSFNETEIEEIKEKLNKSINKIEKKYLNNNLITSKAKETWMDTDFKYDTREGKRIEIQALHLKMLELQKKLNPNLKEEIEIKEENIKKEVRTQFFNGKILADGKEDFTIRPNIFLTYYIYPKLFSNIEWESIFDNSLKQLWLNWGGISSIDKDSELFFENYTGQNNKSYHRGDSWYFVNNLSAICLIRLNYKKYEKYIKKIIEATTNDFLKIGIIGELSEISSAKNQKAEGCLAQTWSSATFIELILEIIRTTK